MNSFQLSNNNIINLSQLHVVGRATADHRLKIVSRKCLKNWAVVEVGGGDNVVVVVVVVVVTGYTFMSR